MDPSGSNKQGIDQQTYSRDLPTRQWHFTSQWDFKEWRENRNCQEIGDFMGFIWIYPTNTWHFRPLSRRFSDYFSTVDDQIPGRRAEKSRETLRRCRAKGGQTFGSAMEVSLGGSFLRNGYGSIPIDTFFVGWTSINPSYDLGFTRYQGFDPSPNGDFWMGPSAVNEDNFGDFCSQNGDFPQAEWAFLMGKWCEKMMWHVMGKSDIIRYEYHRIQLINRYWDKKLEWRFKPASAVAPCSGMWESQ